MGTSYSDDEGEVAIILRYLTDEKYAEYVNNSSHRITANGFIASEDLRSQRANSSQAFVAMWFATEMDEVYQNGIEPAVVGAGYKPMLIRDKEHANKIDDEIIAEIRRSAFLVADFTGHRGGVYFEAGYAMGRALPVIWLCRKDEISKLHFDIRQYNCIDWNTPEEIFKRLQKRIEARIGQGPKQRQ